MTKNDNTPYYINDPYSKDLEGNSAQGSSVLQVTARDDDQGLFGLVQYRITGDDLAPNYFQINVNTGLISVKNVLSGVNQDQFKVSYFTLTNIEMQYKAEYISQFGLNVAVFFRYEWKHMIKVVQARPMLPW